MTGSIKSRTFAPIMTGKTVITRSFIFTGAAREKDAENLLVIRDKAIAKKYIKNRQDHARHSEVCERRGR